MDELDPDLGEEEDVKDDADWEKEIQAMLEMEEPAAS